MVKSYHNWKKATLVLEIKNTHNFNISIYIWLYYRVFEFGYFIFLNWDKFDFKPLLFTNSTLLTPIIIKANISNNLIVFNRHKWGDYYTEALNKELIEISKS